MPDFRYHDAAEQFDAELLGTLADHAREHETKVAAEEAAARSHSDGALERIGKTPLDNVREAIARKKAKVSPDPAARALLADIVTPEKTAAVDAFLGTGKEM